MLRLSHSIVLHCNHRVMVVNVVSVTKTSLFNPSTSPCISSHRHIIYVSDSLAWLNLSTQTSERPTQETILFLRLNHHLWNMEMLQKVIREKDKCDGDVANNSDLDLED